MNYANKFTNLDEMSIVLNGHKLTTNDHSNRNTEYK